MKGVCVRSMLALLTGCTCVLAQTDLNAVLRQAELSTDAKVTELNYLHALELAGSVGGAVYVQTVLAVSDFYVHRNSFEQARDVLNAAVQRQKHEAAAVEDLAPILVRLAEIENELKLWPNQAVTFSDLIEEWSRSEGPDSSVVAHFELVQAASYEQAFQYEDAIASINRAIVILTELYGSHSAAVKHASGILNRYFNRSAPGKIGSQVSPLYAASVVENGIYHSGPGIYPPKPLDKAEPEYTDHARRARYEGTVVLQIVVGISGMVDRAEVVTPLGLGLDERAVVAVRKWKFAPATKNGEPVAFGANVEVKFHLL